MAAIFFMIIIQNQKYHNAKVAILPITTEFYSYLILELQSLIHL